MDEPEAYIRSLIKNEGLWNEQPVSVCDIVELQPTDTLTVHFTVTAPANDQDGHLGGYEMVANYGASLQFSLGKPHLGRRVRRPTPARPGASSRRILRAHPSRSARRMRPRSRRAHHDRTGMAGTTR